MYNDHVFLQQLASNKKCVTPRKVQHLVTEGIRYLDARSDFWREQESDGPTITVCPSDPDLFLRHVFHRMDEDMSRGRINEALRRALWNLQTVRSWPPDALSNPFEALASLHRYAGSSYLGIGNLDKAMWHHGKELTLAEQHGLAHVKSLALDNIGRVHARRGHYEKAICAWERKLDLCRTDLERTWLYHELGQCYLKLGLVAEARDFGVKAVTAAEAASDEVWMMNCSILAGQAELRSGSYQLAQQHFERGWKLSKSTKNIAAARVVQRGIRELRDHFG